MNSLLIEEHLISARRFRLPRVKPEAPANTLIERARLEALSGNWKSCLRTCDRTLETPLSLAGRLSVREIRALASIELGHFSEASRDLKWVESFRPALVTRVALIRIAARETSAARGISDLTTLTRDLAGLRMLNPEAALTLLRAEIDLRRLDRRPVFALAVACWILARGMNHEFPAALAALDASFSGVSDIPQWLRGELEPARARFERIRRLEAEALGNMFPVSTTGLSLRETVYEFPRDPLFPSLAAGAESIESIALLGSQLLLQLGNPLRVEDLSSHPRVLKLLETARNECRKDNLFESIADRAKELGIAFEAESDRLVLKNCWVIEA